ncbi:MAG: ABC transporter ATP-binding protein [Geminicoccaceae bacterium]
MLTVRRLSKRFANGTTALREVDLDAGTGEIVAIVGGSGCGKSTLLRVVAGLERATSGEARLDGELIDGPHPKVGFVFQEPRLMPWLSVAGNVAFGLAHLPKPERERLVAAALHAVGLDRFATALPRELSGGMAQRVALARAVVARPAMLLMDEPFSALDALTRERQQEHLLEVWAQHRVTLLLVTHDVDEALALADRVVVMRAHGLGIERIFDVPLERPRRRTGEAFQRLKERVLDALYAGMAAVPPRRVA